MAKRNRNSRRRGKKHQGNASQKMLFDQTNYILLLIGIGLIFIGFLIMYLENEVHGFISLYISPVLIMGGFLEIVYAIMKKPEEVESTADGSN